MNSIDTAPSPELMQATIKYRRENKIDEPMFRSLLRVQNNEILYYKTVKLFPIRIFKQKKRSEISLRFFIEIYIF